MKRLRKIIILLIVTIGIWLLSNGEAKALTQEEAGQYVASFAKNFHSSNSNAVIYCQTDSERGPGILNQSMSDGYLHMDCVAWVNYAFYHSLHVGNGRI